MDSLYTPSIGMLAVSAWHNSAPIADSRENEVATFDDDRHHYRH